jgi:hypothetical protein
MSQRTKIYRVLLACSLLLGLAVPALAVDGVIEINQATVAAAGGFPFTITQAGSYRLTSNLAVTGGTHGIAISVANVSIDLNGFTISGTGAPSTAGVYASDGYGFNTTVSNGTVQGMGVGVELATTARVEKVRALNNTVGGISVGVYSMVTGSTVSQNGGTGIFGDRGSMISGNVSAGNGASGIAVRAGSIVKGNTVYANSGWGLYADSTNVGVAYGDNFFSANTSGTVTGPAFQLGANVCGSALCP